MIYSAAAKWIGDGSDGCSLDVTTSAASSTINFASATQGTPVRAIPYLVLSSSYSWVNLQGFKSLI